MAATIWYDKRIPGAWSATTAQPGYPAANLSSESLGRPWRSVGSGAEELRADWPSAVGIHTLFVHDVNFATCVVQKSNDGVSFSAVGTLTTYADQEGRRRGRIVVNDAGVKAIKIDSFGAPGDGLSYRRVGAVYFFGTQHTPPADVIFPVLEELVAPAVSQELSNGIEAGASTGTRFSRIETNWQRECIEDLSTIRQKAGKGTILFDAGSPDYPEQQWPVYLPARRSQGESFDRFRFSRLTIRLVERV